MLQEAGRLISQKFNIWITNILDFTPNIVVAILIIVFFYVLSKILKTYFFKLSGKVTQKRSIKNFGTTFFQFLVLGIGIIAAMSVLNLGGVITSLLTGAGVAGLVIGFAMQEIISNYFSGITISVNEPFRRGDFVEIDGFQGVVKEIKARTTIMETPEGQTIDIPNKNVINNPTINYTQLGKRRVDIRSGISYESDKNVAQEIALKVVYDVEGVDKDMPIEFFYEEFGDSTLNFVLRFWMDFGNSQKDFFQLRSEVITKLLEAYNQNDIIMPYPISTVKLQKED